ncbi:MAG: sugar phosphate isomerase/epimerase [Zoogloeaceae bacterium]|jgi:sugar phosphate isomerase/epimerase|nr:sugar phosphate isomerase/epimerase [Zoogloeaceae bacterium]
MKISMNTTATMHGNVIGDIRIARQAGFAGIELQDPHLYRYLDLGLPLSRLVKELDGIEVSAVGCLHDIANHGRPDGPFLTAVDRMCSIARELGAPMIQAITGPDDSYFIRDYREGRVARDDARYRDVLGLTPAEMVEYTASGVAKAARIAAGYGLKIFLEPLAAAPVNTIRQAVQIIEAAGCDNVGVVIDFWHVWTAGETPEYIASLDKALIYNVHLCDGLEFDRRKPPLEPELRDVWLGEGAIPLKEWIDAVKSTGYDGWYTCETFCRRAFEEDPLKTAVTIKNYMDYLFL